MSKPRHDHGKPIRYGNAFPWAGILAGVRRMLFYVFLMAGLLLVLGLIVLVGIALTDNEPIGDYF